MIQILVSACLTGENCKWDGGNNRNEALLDFMERMKGKAEFHPVCPSSWEGFPPRDRLLRCGRTTESLSIQRTGM